MNAKLFVFGVALLLALAFTSFASGQLCGSTCSSNSDCFSSNGTTTTGNTFCSYCNNGFCQQGLPCGAPCKQDTDCSQLVLGSDCSKCNNNFCGAQVTPNQPSLVNSPCPAQAPQTSCITHSGNWLCQAGNFTIQETGNQNVPKYTFWSSSNNDSSAQYKFMFQKIYEATWSNGQLQQSGPSQTSLPSLDWSFTTPIAVQENVTTTVGNTTIVTCYKETTFNITSPSSSGKNSWSGLGFINHLQVTDNHGYGMKFDVYIDNYNWYNTDDSYYLVIEASLTNSANKTASIVNNGTQSWIQIGDAFFQTSATATIMPGNTTVDVELTLTNNGDIALVYSHFPSGSSLFHDPEIGLESLLAQENDICAFSDGTSVCAANDIMISATSAAGPMYCLWESDDDDSLYCLQLLQVFEGSVQNGVVVPVAASVVNASELSFTLTPGSVVGGLAQFTISAESSTYQTVSINAVVDPTVAFIQLNLQLGSYTPKSGNQMYYSFLMTGSSSGVSLNTTTGTLSNSAYFSVESSASIQSSSSSKNVVLVGSSVTLNSKYGLTTSSSHKIIYIIIGAVVGAVVVAAIVAAVIIRRRKHRHYEAI